MTTQTIDIEALRAANVAQEPFPYVIVPNFIRAEAIGAVQADYPPVDLPGSFPLPALKYGPTFKQFMDEIQGPEMTAAIADKFNLDLSTHPTMVTVRGRTDASDGRIHTDSKTKLITVLIYFNGKWETAAGRLRLLRSPDNLNDMVAEVPPNEGTLLAFRNQENAWHGHEPFEGPRRAIQLNWVRDKNVVRRDKFVIASARSLKACARDTDMPLNIATFSNQSGGNGFYKAITHPLVAEKARHLVVHLQKSGPVAIYDPSNQLADFAEFFPLNDIEIAGLYVQDVDKIGRVFRNHSAQPVTKLKDCKCKTVLVAAFDSERLVGQVKHLMPDNTPWMGFDTLRLPDDMITDKRNYLATINFANNYAFFRDADGHHTRIVTANYWGAYGGKNAQMWCWLVDAQGKMLAEWKSPLPEANASVVIDSAEVRKRFNLPEFTGQLFVHVIGAAGHDVVKYALDTYGDDEKVLSCTHDANAWPSDQYAGLPAPTADEEVVLWLQNSHPGEIPPEDVGLNLMGDSNIVKLKKAIPPYGSYRLNIAELLPNAKWPQQIEIQAGKHFVRPRYEIFSRNGHSRISHPNVERSDLKADKRLGDLGGLLGKLHIVPAPILPTDRFINWALPTPMSTAQTHLPVKALIYDARGKQIKEHKFGNLDRNHAAAININEMLNGHKLDGGFGHVEIIYDFDAGHEVDGWLHSLFRYEDRKSGHSAETSFGAHIFNTVLTYKNEPQSYGGKAPGLTTRLFLRTAPEYDALCHLIYPASVQWHESSDTVLILTSNKGIEVAKRNVRIPCSGSLLWRVSEMFTDEEVKQAGPHAYVLIRDTTCRLFGYHGLVNGEASFSLDHMFGF